MKLVLIALFSLATLGLGVTSASALRIGGPGVGNGPGTIDGSAGSCTGISYHGCSCNCGGSGGSRLENCRTAFTDDGMCQFCYGKDCSGSVGGWAGRAMFP